jgi:predicted phage tail protein
VAVSYVVEAGTAPGATLVSLPAGTGTSFSVPGVPNGVFYIRVRAVNAAGTGPASNEATLTVAGGTSPPDAPTNLVPFTAGGLLTFTWQPATTGGVATGFVLEAGSASGQSNLATVQVTGPSFTFNPVPQGFYFLRVRAVNAGGSSPASVEVLINVGDVPAPPPPPSFTSSPVSGRRVTLNWSAPATGTVTGYIIEAGSATGLSNLASVNTGTTATTASFDNVPPGTYFIRLRAVNAQGASVVSNERTVTVQ